MPASIIYGSPDPDFHKFGQTIVMGGVIPEEIQDAPINSNEEQNVPFQMFTTQHGNGKSGMFGPGPYKEGGTNIIRGQEFVQTLHNSLVSNF